MGMETNMPRPAVYKKAEGYTYTKKELTTISAHTHFTTGMCIANVSTKNFISENCILSQLLDLMFWCPNVRRSK